MHRLQFILLLTFLIGFSINEFLVTSGNSTTRIRADQAKQDTTILKTPANIWAHVFLERKKRYLLFEKGASFVFTLNIGKNIISGRPRGLVQVNEISLYYDLPYNLETLLPKIPKRPSRPTRTKPTTRIPKTTTTTSVYNWFPENYHFRGENYRYYRNVKGSEKRKGWTMKMGNMTSTFGNQCQQQNQHQQQSRKLRQFRHQGSIMRRKQSSILFFDIIEQWALLLRFNGRYCILRTLCEAPHLLFDAGDSLFHDILHILIDFSWPYVQTNISLRRCTSSRNIDLDECANLYGPHCRLSFLQHFTQLIHGDRF